MIPTKDTIMLFLSNLWHYLVKSVANNATSFLQESIGFSCAFLIQILSAIILSTFVCHLYSLLLSRNPWLMSVCLVIGNHHQASIKDRQCPCEWLHTHQPRRGFASTPIFSILGENANMENGKKNWTKKKLNKIKKIVVTF